MLSASHRHSAAVESKLAVTRQSLCGGRAGFQAPVRTEREWPPVKTLWEERVESE